MRRGRRRNCRARGACYRIPAARSTRTLDLADMRSLLLAAIVLTAPAQAADFGVLDFGSPCDSIRALEEARNSVPIPWARSEDEGFHAFRGRAFERDASIIYACVKGHLCTGNYFFPEESLEAAVESYHKFYNDFVVLYGAPILDNSPWQLGAASMDPRLIAADPRRYMISWQTSRVHASMRLFPPTISDGALWQVSVIMSAVNK